MRIYVQSRKHLAGPAAVSRAANVPDVPVVCLDGCSLSSVQLVPTPGLPHRFTVSDGTSIVVRDMRPDDIPKFYATLRAVSDAGMGYGVDELPDINYFVQYYVDGWRNIVFELADDGDPISFANSEGPTTFSRSVNDSVIVDGGNMVIVPKYQRRGWYSDMLLFYWNIALLSSNKAIVGYLGDTVVTNVFNYLTARKFGYRINGIMPRGIFMKGRGWLDVMLYYSPSEDTQQMIFKMMRRKLETPDVTDANKNSKL
jgi:hypothetical protein